MVPVAITGAVGVAAVAGTIINAKITGNSARETARLNINAEDRRAYIADKRRVYARAIAAIETAVTAVSRVPDGGVAQREGDADRIAAVDAALLAAADALGELQLTAPPKLGALAAQAVDELSLFRRGKTDAEPIRNTRRALVEGLYDDLQEETQRMFDLARSKELEPPTF